MTWPYMRSGIMTTITAITCPCHLPFILPFLLSILAGTSAAVWITQYIVWVYGGMTFIFLVSLLLTFRWMKKQIIQQGELT